MARIINKTDQFKKCIDMSQPSFKSLNLFFVFGQAHWYSQ